MLITTTEKSNLFLSSSALDSSFKSSNASRVSNLISKSKVFYFAWKKMNQIWPDLALQIFLFEFKF